MCCKNYGDSKNKYALLNSQQSYRFVIENVQYTFISQLHYTAIG